MSSSSLVAAAVLFVAVVSVVAVVVEVQAVLSTVVALAVAAYYRSSGFLAVARLSDPGFFKRHDFSYLFPLTSIIQ